MAFEKVADLRRALGMRLERVMVGMGWSAQMRALVWHWLVLFWDTAVAVVPITLLLIAALGIFFNATTPGQGKLWGGLSSATIGLVLFIDGLRIAVMPLGELLGKRLPSKYPMWIVLVIAFCLGVLVTYAEPAITSLRPLATLVDPSVAPYLYFLMNSRVELFIMAIGLGVGVAAVVGTLRFVYDWNIKPLILVVIVPTIALACYMMWGDENLRPLIGIAWDCGAVTTGPVTVPVLLAVGIGIADCAAAERLKKDPNLVIKEDELRGFGIVTLASLFPIIAVELMSIFLTLQYSNDYIVESAKAAALAGPSESTVDKPPVSCIVYAIRSIMPLNVFLLLVIIFLLKEPLPDLTIFTIPPPTEDSDALPTMKKGEEEDPRDDASKGNDEPSLIALSDEAAPNQIKVYTDTLTEQDSKSQPPVIHKPANQVAPFSVELSAADGQPEDPRDSIATISVAPPAPIVMVDLTNPGSRPNMFSRAWWYKNGPLMMGICMCQAGMILFNIGSVYAFTKISNQAGLLLPATYHKLPDYPESPYYSYVGGIFLLMLVTFGLGYLATCAEPALQVLGNTVQRLSRGQFTKSMLVGAVAVGVGIGMAVGATKILFGVPLLYFILGKYTLAGILTYFTRQDICAVAWDSAGVTTGPVTVPYVLALGIGYSTAVSAVEGFGMLTVASVVPICSVLITNMLSKPVQEASRYAGNEFKKAHRKLSRSLSTVSRNIATKSRELGSVSRGLGSVSRGLGTSSRRSGVSEEA